MHRALAGEQGQGELLDKGGSGNKSAAPSRSSRQLPPVAAGLDGDSEQEATSWPSAPPAMGPFKQVLPLMREDGPSIRHTVLWWKMQQGHPPGHVTEGAPSKWEGQIFVKRAGFRTTVLEVTSDDSVASVKARFKWCNARLLRHSRELWDDTRSLGSEIMVSFKIRVPDKNAPSEFPNLEVASLVLAKISASTLNPKLVEQGLADAYKIARIQICGNETVGAVTVSTSLVTATPAPAT